MATDRTLELGNLVCRFGDQVLLDFLDEVVIPAFKDSGLSRKRGNTEYFLLGVQIANLGVHGGETYKGIAGRIVKNTRLIREQVYDKAAGLTRSRKTLRTAPSSIFVLILNQHRLLYMKEMVDSPSMSEFRSTMLSFFKYKHGELTDREYEALKEDERGMPWGEKTSRIEFLRKYPRPTLEIIPLSSGEDIDVFIDRYATIKYVEFLFKDRNDEVDDASFYEALQKKQEALGDAKLRFSDREGLPKEKVKSEVAAATESGNQRVIISGVDTGGDKLVGNNDDFKIKKPVEALVGGIKDAAKSMFTSFMELVADGVVKNPKTPVNKKEVVNNLRVDR
ncbi:hypothetical protein KK141_22545 [Dyella sp. LX-66]|uniref:hypothetical protein n=1 Tax=unclassified Dyella TaxID=2634549 RepID=UPI001BDF89F4|nr:MULTISPECIES: hypothetical protein [unclassified Dyella]MBT2119833.1 hypothetical protein [Dyella sp. LX-1]MBT2142342.1 hypothetical protein [Dyella sp. LX-66]